MAVKRYQAVEVAIAAAASAKKNIILVGDPGIGKSATVFNMQNTYFKDYRIITIIGSRMDPTDVAGLPVKAVLGKKDNGEDLVGTVLAPPQWQIESMIHKKVILFFDEFSNTPGAVRAALLNVFQERMFGNGDKIPDETIIIAAMNPTDQAADGFELDTPTTNRFTWIPFDPSLTVWYEGMLDAWGKWDKISDGEKYWRNMIVGFIKKNPSFLHRMPNDDEIALQAKTLNINDKNPSEMECFRAAWSSRRSWDNLSQILGALPEEAKDDTYVISMIMRGTVGARSALDFQKYINEQGSVNPEKVLENPESFDWATMRVDQANMVFSWMVEHMDSENWRKVYHVFDVVSEPKHKKAGQASGYIHSLSKQINKIGISRSERQEITKVATEVYTKYQKIADQMNDEPQKSKF